MTPTEPVDANANSVFVTSLATGWRALARGLFLALALLQVRVALALDPTRSLIEHVRVSWSADSGLPQSTVRAVAQSQDGYLWLATHEGLARFDGRQFFVFNEANAPALRGSGISALLSAKDGSLWVGLRDGGVAKYEAGSFRALASEGGIPNGVVTVLREDNRGRLWVGTSGGGVGYTKDGKGRVFTTADKLPHDSVQAIETVADDSVYVGTANGLAVFREGLLVAESVLPAFDTSPIGAVYLDRQGRLWIGVGKVGLFVKEKGDWRRFARAEDISDQIKRVIVDRDGMVWIGGLGGLSRIHDARIETIAARDGLSSNYVRDLLEDAEGNIWVGTEGGLERFRDGYISNWDATRGLTEEFARAVLETKNGDTWIATSNGLFQERAGKLRRYDSKNGLVSAAALSLAEDSDGTLWVGSNSGGLHRLQGETFINMGESAGLESAPVRAILPTRAGQLWVGTATKLVRIDERGMGRARAFGAVEGLKTDQILSLYEDTKGQVWVGSRAGVYVVQGDVVSDVWRQRGVTSAVFSILEDGDSLLLTTGRGLFALKGDRVIPIGTEQGLPSRVYFRLFGGDEKTFWACSNSGIVRIAKDQLRNLIAGKSARMTPQFFDRADGMATTQCNGGSQPAGWQARDGRVLFPTARGVAIFDPKRELRRNTRPPPVHVTRVSVDNEPLANMEKVTLARAARRIEIGFVGLSFVDADRVRYRYRLEGFDTDWIDAGREQYATYTNLPSGSYRFRVIAANNDGVWSEKGAAIAIDQRAALHESWWFRGALLAMLALLAFGAYLVRVRTFRRQSQRLQVLVDERTHELAQANLRLDTMAHADGLTGIANRRRLDEYLSTSWANCRDQQRQLGVVVIDADHFKQFNDEKGHLAGDELLIRLSQTLQRCLRRSEDLLARYGGEEFIVVMPGADIDVTKAAAESMLQAVLTANLGVTVSIGVCARQPSAGGTPADLVAAADTALYAAKRAGRNQLKVCELPAG